MARASLRHYDRVDTGYKENREVFTAIASRQMLLPLQQLATLLAPCAIRSIL